MKRLVSHLSYDWWRYLLVALLAVILWTWVFDSLAQPKDNERIYICYFGDDFLTLQCRQNLVESLSRYTAQPIREITVEHRGSSADRILPQLVETGVYASDLMVFEQGVVDDQVLRSYINRLDTQMLEDYFAETDLELSYYCVEGVPYGVMLESLPGYTGSKGCIVCLSPNSVNLARMYDRGFPGDDGSLAALRCWLEDKK